LNNAEPVFPGFAAESFQTSYRTSGSITFRSTLGSNIVNELRTGWQSSPNNFFGNVNAGMFEDQAGFRLDFPLITDPTVANHNNPAPRNTPNWNIDNTLNWLKGSHSLSLGGSFLQITHNQNSANVVPTLTVGVDTNGFDPANGMFTTANFPNASTGNLNQARDIYSILTGRLTAVGGTARLDANTGEYVYLGNLYQRSRLSSFALYAQDSWRRSPTVTLNYGLRWDLQRPFTGLTNTWSTVSLEDICGASGIGSGTGGRECNLFKPGDVPGGASYVPTYEPFTTGARGYRTDWNNFSPNIGIAWRPSVQGGVLRTLLGDPEQATVRAAYSLNYSLERMDRFTGLYGSNPGGSITATRNYNTGYPLGPGPVLFRDRARLGPPDFPTRPEYPLTPTAASDDVNMFDADIETPFVQSYSIGLQRSLGRDTAIEVRYVGNRNHNAWTMENWNELVLFENGFFDEFRRAQANLATHVAQGCGSTANPCTFAYRGPGSGTSPLPIYLAYFQGLPQGRANEAGAYTSANFRNSAWTGHLGYHEPDVEDAANDLHASLNFRGNAIAAGLPANFFVMNPAIDDANVTKSLAGTQYHSGQIEVRRRLASGLLVNGSYTYAFKRESSLQSLRFDRFYLNGTDVPHSFKVQWLYEIPVGSGRRFGNSLHPLINGILGDWEFSGIGRLQQQQFTTSDGMLFGMTQDELQDAFEIRTVRSDTGSVTVFSFPQDIVDNTRRAFATDPTSPSGYGSEGPPTGRYIGPASSRDCVAVYDGDCGAPRQIILGAPLFSRWDMRVNKRFPFGRRASAELIFEVQNVFDSPNFNHVFDPTPNTAADTFRVTSAYTDINTTFDPGGRIGQIAWRFSW
jgi:hypothetical protein